ncbi:MAG TPA: helix-turn-helix domain-containing protein [Pseudonocardia sp.]|jgi:transcriptional regulator of acetoin/glycerol metabolism|uniref:helix-turn-helix domain-containing protein n=1 Tax=Pseudonocardia sp. TaxID=60912 RepID=UPI002B4B2C65|nr:helix-turn-helix domain-containing protein [Pseudonocardia sp.]HLU54928.1 helix-turn-helix domain-containing protein [Pseudonocardia sp.]
MAVPVPRTTTEWDRVREAKHDVLSRDPLSVDPADYPGVRPEVVASWRRSMLAGVDPAAREYVLDEDFRPGTRLAAVAQPIMDRLGDEIADLSSWGFLADRACRLLTVAVGDFPDALRLHRQNLRAGMTFAEDVMGTNGMGCAHETQRAFIVSGTEHYRTDTEILTTTGVLIRDPFTKRFAGIFGAHCLREYGSAALLPLVVEIGRSIETQLLISRTDGERELFDAYSAAERRHRGAVVAVSRRLVVVSTEGRALVRDADEELLRELAKDAGDRARTVRRRLSTGVTATIQVLPVRQPRGEFAAVLVLEPVERPASVGWSGDDRPTDFRERLARALGEGRRVLLSGERGCGKRHEARAALRAVAGRVVEVDAAAARLDPDDWLRGLRSAVGTTGAAVLLAHVQDVPAEIATTVAHLVEAARCPVVATGGEDGGPAVVGEAFPVVVPVPPLRERRDEFPQLCAALLAAAGAGPAELTPRAAAALAAGDWPGNVRQLQQVLTSARIRATGPAIDLPDLPAHHHRPPLDEVQRAERRVLAAALREAGGDRNTVAKRLGISRATVYRKLKRYQLR